MINPDTVEFLPLNKGWKALVDKDIYERVKHHKWHVAFVGTRTYVARGCKGGGKAKLILIHNVIFPKVDGLEVDHINADTPFCVIDERRSNLRYATHLQNLFNKRKQGTTRPDLRSEPTSQFKGVYKATRGLKWCAQIRYDGKSRYLGGFSSEEEAAKVYDAAALKHFKAFARLNFPTIT